MEGVEIHLGAVVIIFFRCFIDLNLFFFFTTCTYIHTYIHIHVPAEILTF